MVSSTVLHLPNILLKSDLQFVHTEEEGACVLSSQLSFSLKHLSLQGPEPVKAVQSVYVDLSTQAMLGLLAQVTA